MDIVHKNRIARKLEEYKERVRDATDFPGLVAETIPLPRQPQGSRAVMVKCPWHQDNTPSLAIYTDHAHCFGACGHFDAFGWLMKRDNLGFREALYRLAERAGIPRLQWTPEQERAVQERRAVEDTLALAAAYFQETLWSTGGVAALEYARGRGWTDDTIREAGLGYCDGDRRALAVYLRARGIGEQTKAARAVLAIPARMLVYSHQRAGRVEYLSARSIEGKGHYNLLADLVGPRRPYYNSAWVSKPDELIIVEGPADAITLAQWGVPAVALVGCAGFPDHDLARVRRAGTVYLALDNDEAGRQSIPGLAEALGPLVQVVTWPDSVKDANEWLQAGATAEDLRKLLDTAPTWLDLQIEKAARAQGVARDRAIESLFPLLTQLQPITLARYKVRVVKALKEIGARDFDCLLKAAQKTETDEPTPEVKLLEGRYPVVAPALDFLDGLAVVTVPLLALVGGRPTYLPYLITSDRQMLAADGQMMDIGERKVILRNPPTALGSIPRWEYADIRAYLQGDSPDPIEAYLETERLLDKYIDFRDEGTSDVLALWIAGTYLYPVFEAYPYVALQGPKGSGKTKVLDVMAKLAFNARIASSMSSASLFRVVQATRGMLGIDEAERLSDSKDPLATELRLLLNAGYKSGSPAIRCEGDDHQVVEFQVYGPKMIASIRGLEDVLESRCVLINMLRTAGPKGNLVVSERGEDWARARHGLYCFALQNFAGVRDAYLHGAGADGLNNRQAELWRPLLAIGSYLDNKGAEGLLALVKDYAWRKAARAEETSLDDWRTALVLALCKLVKSGKTRLMPKEVRDAMSDFVETDDPAEIRPTWVGYRLREFGFRRERVRKGSVYIVTEDVVLDIMQRYDVSADDQLAF